jgi:hypothetical protein
MEEIWKQIVLDGEKWNYQVSNMGRIKILNANTCRNLTDKKTMMVCVLSKDGIKKDFVIHRLVATFFIPNPDNKQFIEHKDGDYRNNCADNLKWIDKLSNLKTAKKSILRFNLNKSIESKVRYECVNDAVAEFGSHIHSCLSGTSTSAYGYYWEYEHKVEKPVIDITNFKDIKNHPNYMISQDGQVYNKKRQTLLKPRKSGGSVCVLLDKKNYTVTKLVKEYFPL